MRIHGIKLTPGQLAALTDYIDPCCRWPDGMGEAYRRIARFESDYRWLLRGSRGSQVVNVASPHPARGFATHGSRGVARSESI